MKCDELQRHSIRGEMYNGEEICGCFSYYDADEVDAAIAELKQKLEDAMASAYAESVDAGMRERRLKARIAELEKENESLKYSVADLEIDLAMDTRWRKVSEEFPEDGETVIVLLGRTPKTRGFFLTSRYVAGGWTYGEDPQGCKPTHWFRIPKAPEVK